MSNKIYSQQELTDAFRGAIEDRATWFYLLLKAAKEQNVDIDKLAKDSITYFGILKGRNFGEVATPGEFVDKLAQGHAFHAFEMNKIEGSEQKGVLRFKYCALVESWKKLGCNGSEIAELCRLARNGDYGVASCFPKLELKFNKLLSEGDEYCELEVINK